MPCDVFDRAIKEKRDTYDDLVANRRCAFVVLAAGTGGHWHADCIRFVRDLARYRASSEPVVLRRSMQLAYQRRWWRHLLSALHKSIAAALNPSSGVVKGAFPVASAIDIWVRDLPTVSTLPARSA